MEAIPFDGAMAAIPPAAATDVEETREFYVVFITTPVTLHQEFVFHYLPRLPLLR